LRRELFQKGKTGNYFATFRDVPKQWEAWNIDAEYEKHRLELWQLKQYKIVEQALARNNSVRTENRKRIHSLAVYSFLSSFTAD